MTDSWILFETSGRSGRVGVAIDGRVVGEVVLDESRRHARDLAACTGALLSQAGLTPSSVRGVMVSVGPGSFTGLRVGVTSAKLFAYASGCELIAVPTFHAIANRVSSQFRRVDVIADALQGHVYSQRFAVEGAQVTAENELRIESLDQWLTSLPADVAVTGPGIAVYDSRIPSDTIKLEAGLRLPTIESLLHAGRRLTPISKNEIAALEPIYLRGSSAEEKAKAATIQS
ncbi:MAG: tRNA (adenosine(37)-N6)-threonylcarbamoyltransferase complex dimerization subunit type 1 TsaB [Gemmataceae bacterium]